MKKIITNIILVGLVAVIVIVGTFLYYYKGVYVQSTIVEYQIPSSTVSQPKTYSDMFNQTPGMIVFDKAHKNSFKESDINILLERLVNRGNSIEYWTNSSKKQLKKAKALVIVSPKEPFTENELLEIESFLNKGGKLFLIADNNKILNINSLALNFGILFKDAYLYNMEKNDGNFRYILMDQFSDNTLTKGLSSIAMYVACPVLPAEQGIVFTNHDTLSSASEIKEKHSTVVLQDNILALCDTTFMRDPYNAYYDNNRFISNIADWLTIKQEKLIETNTTNHASNIKNENA